MDRRLKNLNAKRLAQVRKALDMPGRKMRLLGRVERVLEEFEHFEPGITGADKTCVALRFRGRPERLLMALETYQVPDIRADYVFVDQADTVIKDNTVIGGFYWDMWKNTVMQLLSMEYDSVERATQFEEYRQVLKNHAAANPYWGKN